LLLGAETAAGRVLRAGAAKSNTTPALGCSIPGGMQDRKAAHVHDELHARCLVLDDGATSLAIAVCDAVALSGTTIARAKQLIRERLALPPERVLVAATHTHSGPPTVSVFQSDADPAYCDWLAARIADGVQRAATNRRPARIGWGQGREERAVFNRRYRIKPGESFEDPWGRTADRVKMNPGYANPKVGEPAGPTDPAVSVLAIQGVDGRMIAVVGNYTLHYVGGERGGDVSADYFGAWADAVERACAAEPDPNVPPVVAILTNGCSGDVNNIDTRNKPAPRRPYEQIQNISRLVADEALRVVRGIEYQDSPPLAMAQSRVELATRKPSADDLRQARAVLAKASPNLGALNEIYARETVLLEPWLERVEAPVQAIRVGDLAIVTFPGEAFVEMGLEVKQKSPFALTVCIELANDYLGYIPTVRAHEDGGYETWRARSSFLEHRAAPSLVAAALELLSSLAPVRP
jgi:hypothetical protein